jgi:dTMP kinase
MSTASGLLTALRPAMRAAQTDDDAAGARTPLARLDYAGALVVVEGVDGSGKSTQIQLLRQHLQEQGADVLFTEWNSSSLTREAIRTGKKRLWLGPLSFALLHAADFAHRFENVILPALRGGKIVLADRYVFTAFARDAARGLSPAALRQGYGYAVQPDLALYFRVPLEVGMQRVLTGEGRSGLKHYEAGLDLGLSADPEESYRLFQGRVVAEYDRIVPEYGLHVVDADRPVAPQHQEVRALVAPLLRRHLDLKNRRRGLPRWEVARAS